MSISASGSVAGAFAFSLVGDPAIGSEQKDVDLSAAVSISHGTGPGQATAGWAALVSIPANSVYAVNLASADASHINFDGVVQFTEARALWVRNTSELATAVVLLGCPSSGNDTSAWAARLVGGAKWCWDNFVNGMSITAANQTLTLTNTSSAAVVVEIGVIGLGSYVDA